MISDPVYCAGCKGVYDEVKAIESQYLAASAVVTEKEHVCINCGSSDLVDYDEKAAEVLPKMKPVAFEDGPYGNDWYAYDDNTYCGCGECGGLAWGADKEEAIKELVYMTVEAGTYDE